MIRHARGIVALGAGAVLAASLTAAATMAHANPTPVGIVQNTSGVAGYFANDNGQTRFRDVQADTTVVPQIKNLNGTSNGALGVELCNPNDGHAAQLGVWWNGTKYQVVYATGNLNTALTDACIMTGLITPTPQTLLTAFTINQGDRLHFEIFWQPHGFHAFHFNVCDITQDVCRQAVVPTGWENLYEAGIGAVSNANTITAPANIGLDVFTGTKFNYYSSTHAWNTIFVPAHWKLDQADFINSSSQVVMSSNGGLNGAGTTFPLFEGSTSP